jgi:hypothetical protein
MADLGEFETMNKVYEEILRGHLGDEPLPARTTFQAGKVPRDARYSLFGRNGHYYNIKTLFFRKNRHFLRKVRK